MKHSIIKISVLLTVLLIGSYSAQSQITCNSNEAKQLDFMLGNWEFFSKDGTLLGQNSIELVFGTCMIEENYESVDGLKTHSITSYDAENHRWTQIWTDEFGSTVNFSGTFKNNILALRATAVNSKGKKTYHRLTYSKKTNGTMSQIWQKSTNQKEWTTIFEGTLKQKKAVL